jgi:hypothetical protein
MPPRASNLAGDWPCTQSKNANVHPRTVAQEALRVNAPRRDPTIIQREKDAVKERKALKVQEKETNQARDEATKSIGDEFRAQQASKQASGEAEMPHKKSKGKCQYRTFLRLTYILVTKKIPLNVPVSGNTKTSSSQLRATGLTNTETIGKKRKSEPQVDVSTPAQDAEQPEALPPPPKKKMKASRVEHSTTAVTERNNCDLNHNASSKIKGTDSAKKRPTGDEFDDASVIANLAHPAKKSKVNKLAVVTRGPIHRSGKTNLNF